MKTDVIVNCNTSLAWIYKKRRKIFFINEDEERKMRKAL